MVPYSIVYASERGLYADTPACLHQEMRRRCGNKNPSFLFARYFIPRPKTVTETSIARCYQRLQEAQDNGTWQQELRPIRRALSSLRTKLRQFDLEISNIRERGCSLAGLAVKTYPKNKKLRS